jgi:hypothetical protein
VLVRGYGSSGKGTVFEAARRWVGSSCNRAEPPKWAGPRAVQPASRPIGPRARPAALWAAMYRRGTKLTRKLAHGRGKRGFTFQRESPFR